MSRSKASLPRLHYAPHQHRMTRCQADDDDDCEYAECPQLRDGEPKKSARHCPLDQMGDDDD